MKILKNTTGVDITLEILGLTIPATSQITINVEDYLELSSEDSTTELDILITSGDVVVNDGTSDLIATVGKAFIRFPDIASNELFDDTNVIYSADTVQEAIEKVSNGEGKRYLYLKLVRSGEFTNSWLSYTDQGVRTDRAPWTPQFDVDVIRITFTNKERGTNDHPLHARVIAYVNPRGDTGVTSTSDPEAWYITSDGSNIVYYEDRGRKWEYDNEAEGDIMTTSNQYSFRLNRESDEEEFDDVYIEILMRER